MSSKRTLELTQDGPDRKRVHFDFGAQVNMAQPYPPPPAYPGPGSSSKSCIRRAHHVLTAPFKGKKELEPSASITGPTDPPPPRSFHVWGQAQEIPWQAGQQYLMSGALLPPPASQPATPRAPTPPASTIEPEADPAIPAPPPDSFIYLSGTCENPFHEQFDTAAQVSELEYYNQQILEQTLAKAATVVVAEPAPVPEPEPEPEPVQLPTCVVCDGTNDTRPLEVGVMCMHCILHHFGAQFVQVIQGQTEGQC